MEKKTDKFETDVSWGKILVHKESGDPHLKGTDGEREKKIEDARAG